MYSGLWMCFADLVRDIQGFPYTEVEIVVLEAEYLQAEGRTPTAAIRYQVKADGSIWYWQDFAEPFLEWNEPMREMY